MEKRKEKIVVLIDVLGFEYSFKKNGLDAILEKYKRLTKNSIIASADRGIASGLLILLDGKSINYAFFSDTIVFWMEVGDQSKTFAVFNLLLQSLNELICQSIEEEFPIRGGISIGDCILNKEESIYIGQPIISAARAETAQNWIGIAFASDFGGVGINAEYVLPYTGHYKNERKHHVKDVVLDYPRHWRKTRTESIVNKITNLKAKQNFKDENEERRIGVYYNKSIEFCKYSEEMEGTNWASEVGNTPDNTRG